LPTGCNVSRKKNNIMPHVSKKQLESIAQTVTGIGWADTKQAAVYLSLGYQTIRSAIKDGEIKASRVGRLVRVRYSDLDEYMLARRMSVSREIDELLP